LKSSFFYNSLLKH